MKNGNEEKLMKKGNEEKLMKKGNEEKGMMVGMREAIVFLTNGFEEIEALAVVDILRRGGVDTVTVALADASTVTLADTSTDSKSDLLAVTGSHAITVQSDMTFRELSESGGVGKETVLVLPGGPGTAHYKQYEPLLSLLSAHYHAGGRMAAICAAPSILGMLGLLEGKTAVCYPGYEAALTGARIGTNPVETDGAIITADGAGSALAFALTVLKAIKGEEIAEKVQEQIRYAAH